MPVALTAIARSLDTPEELGPHLAEIFAPLSSLGGSPRQTVTLLHAGGIGPGSRVIELACGKGAAAIAAARALGCRVDASDGYGPFIEDARRAAEKRGVDHLCSFRVADAAAFEKQHASRRCDAAVMIALWPAARAAKALRRLVRSGGVYLVDDAVLMPGAPRRFHQAGLRTREEIRALFESLDDLVLREVIQTVEQSRRHEERLHARLARRCETLARREPSLRPALRRFLAQQRRSIEDLCGPVRGAVWLVRRAGSSAPSKTQGRLLARSRL